MRKPKPFIIAASLVGAAALALGGYHATDFMGEADATDSAPFSVNGFMKGTITVAWPPQEGATGYKLFKNGTQVATAGPNATSTKFSFVQGQNSLSVVAVTDPVTTTVPTTVPTTTPTLTPTPTITPTSCTGVQAFPGQDLSQVSAQNPDGSTICINPGVYRLASVIVPRTGQKFIGQPGAVLNGSIDISNRFAASGSLWMAGGMTQESKDPPVPEIPSPCRTSNDVCMYRNDVYLDDLPLTRVLSQSELSAGEFYFDYAMDRIYLFDNPTGRKVELAVTDQAFAPVPGHSNANVLIKGLIVEKFSSRVQTGAIYAATSWTVENNEIRYNHAIGLQGGGNVRGNHIHHNGWMGLAGYDIGTIIDGNEINNNEYAQGGCWEGGGTKFLRTTNLIVRNNFVHHHTYCPGLWTDWDNIYTLFENNTVEDNGGPGIFHEASFDAVIRNNIVKRNGYGAEFQGWIDGGGILVNSSRNVEIYGNQLDSNRHGISVTHTERGSSTAHGLREVRNLNVHDNTTKMGVNSNIAGGLASNIADVYTRNNRFANNTYVLCSGKPELYAWINNGSLGYISRTQWKAAGNDITGTFSTVTC